MKPLRKYKEAWLKQRNSDFEKIFEVCIYQSLIIYFDEKGNERTLPIHFVEEVVEYAEDRIPKEGKP
jgi:hypothetical protein